MKTWIAVVAVMMQLVVLAGAGWAAPFTKIVSPVQGQCLAGPDVVVKFEAGGMSLGPKAWNLHFKLDDEPFQVQYNGNHAHTFKNVLPGTHTVRVYAANAMHEAIPGTQSIVTFSVGYWDGANAPVPGAPILTFNLPQGEYLGIDAADITVDFLLENIQLSPGGYQVAYYVDGRRFLVQHRCGPQHIKNLAPGLHRVRVELQDQFGDLVPGPFNSGERVIAVSPDSVVKSAPVEADGYAGLPRLHSVKGSMTMGQHWVATEPAAPLTEEDIARKDVLTVKTGQGTVALRDGEAIEYPSTASTTNSSDGDDVSTIRTNEEEIESFSVRQGGAPEVTPELESAVPDTTVQGSSNVRSGSIIINSEEVETGPRADIKLPTPEEPAVAKADPITTKTTRVRADGSISRVLTTGTQSQSTASLRLADRPGVRTPPAITTGTVRVDEPGTTRSVSRVERATTGSAVRANDRNTTRSASDRSTTRSASDRRSTGTRGNERQGGDRALRPSRSNISPPAAKID